MSTDQDLPEGRAPRVRRDGPGGLHIVRGKKASGHSAWWRLVGDNGEILAHSETYASLGNAARGADAAERTVLRNAHDAGPELFEVLLRMDALVHGQQTGRADVVEIRKGVAEHLGGTGWQDPDALLEVLPDLRDHLLDLAAVATHWAHDLTDEGGES